MKNKHYLQLSPLLLSPLLLHLLLLPMMAFSQSGGGNLFSMVIVNGQRQPISGATVRLVKNGRIVDSRAAGENGQVVFEVVIKGKYTALISSTGASVRSRMNVPRGAAMSSRSPTLRRVCR